MDNPSLSDFLPSTSRTSTFLSIDVAGSTDMKSGEDERDIMDTFLAYHKQASDLAYAHHGEVASITGDGLMCRFQKADDAARMGEAMLLELRRFNKNANKLAKPLRLRVGIHTGEVRELQGVAMNQWISQTIDVAAKIQQGTPVDHLRMSEATYAQITEGRDAYLREGWNATLQINLYVLKAPRGEGGALKKLPEVARILLVDNELDDLARLRTALTSRRHDLLVTYSPPQASAVLDLWKPHAIMLSLDLAWDSGWNALADWRRLGQYSGIPVMALSHQTSGEWIQKAFKLGANAFVRKPIEEQQALKRLDVVLREFYL